MLQTHFTYNVEIGLGNSVFFVIHFFAMLLFVMYVVKLKIKEGITFTDVFFFRGNG